MKKFNGMINFFAGDNGNCEITINNSKEKVITNVFMTNQILSEFKGLVGENNVEIYEKE